MARKQTSPLIEMPHPMTRADLLGQDAAQNIFLSAWNNRNTRPMHPAWILAGPQGVGKATLAHRIARFIFSSNSDTNSTLEIPQDSTAFRRYVDGGYADLTIISLETDPEEKTEISVSAVRRMTDSLRTTASDGGWRVVIIDSIDDMNRNAANSLLKILEEPPAKTLFLIVAHSLSAVLPTIRSRSVVLRMGTLPASDIQKIIMQSAGMDADMERIARAAKISSGSVSRAISLLGGNLDDFPDMFSIAEMISDATIKASKLLEISKSLAQNFDTMNVLLDVIHHLARRAPLALARLYSQAAHEIKTADALNLERDAVAFKIIRDIRKCLSIPIAI